MEFLSLIGVAIVCLMVGAIGGLLVFALAVATSNESSCGEHEEIIKEREIDE